MNKDIEMFLSLILILCMIYFFVLFCIYQMRQREKIKNEQRLRAVADIKSKSGQEESSTLEALSLLLDDFETSPKSANYHYSKVNAIKEMFDKNIYPPIYDQKDWGRGMNCYSYALDIPVKDSKQEIWIPGCISDPELEPVIFNLNDFIKRFEKDLEFLGFNFRIDEENAELKDGEYKIAVFYFPTFHDWPVEFHFARTDSNSYWSEKKSWTSQPTKLDTVSTFSIPTIPIEKIEHLRTYIVSKKN